MDDSLIDISRVINAQLPEWPGDAKYEHDWTMQQQRGDSVNVGRIALSVHLGTHVDAPLHFDSTAAAVDELPLAVFLGPAWVVDVEGRALIKASDFPPPPSSAFQRLLFRTHRWPAGDGFPDSVPVLEEMLPEKLAEWGIRLVGVDVPSVDLLDSKHLPLHHALHRRGIHILESLNLQDVAPGGYELIALPLPLAGLDGSPVRAVLRCLPDGVPGE